MLRKNSRSNHQRIASINPDVLIEENGCRTETEQDRLRQFLCSLESGDHIAATRRNGMYEHHGIYEGTDCGYPSVIHFQGPITSLVKGSASLSCISKCGYHHPKKGGLVFSCLDCFSQGNKMFKIRYMTQRDFVTDQDPNWNHLKPGKVIAGYCSKKYYLELYMGGELYGHSRLPIEKLQDYTLDDRERFYEMSSERTIKEVLGVAWESKLKPYSLGCNNCEHFAVFCKTGLCISIQVKNLPIPFICEDGKRVCRLKRRCVSGVQTEQENLNQEGKGSSDEKKNKMRWSCFIWKCQRNKTK